MPDVEVLVVPMALGVGEFVALDRNMHVLVCSKLATEVLLLRSTSTRQHDQNMADDGQTLERSCYILLDDLVVLHMNTCC